MRIALLAVCVWLTSGTAYAFSDAYGMGANSCRTMTTVFQTYKDDRDSQWSQIMVVAWAQGFVSGMNYSALVRSIAEDTKSYVRYDGKPLDENGGKKFIAFAETYCATHPDYLFHSAVEKYLEISGHEVAIRTHVELVE